MKKIKTTLLVILVVTGVNNMNAQLSTLVKTPWVFGLGFNLVADNGNANMVPFPSQLNIEKFLTKGISVEGIACYNTRKIKFHEGKQVSSKTISFFSLDGNINYHLNDFFVELGKIDPYLVIGYGMTANDGKWDNPTSNLGAGSCFWIKNRLGIKVQAEAKWTLADATTNYMQFSCGMVYKLGGEIPGTKTVSSIK